MTYQPTPEQEKALRSYLRSAVVPLIEQVLVKKLGQAMTFAAQEVLQPKREWQGLTADELNMIGDIMRTWNSHSLTDVYVAIEAKLKEKNI